MKPLSINLRNVKEELINLLNGSQLPIDMLAYVTAELNELVQREAERAYQQDLRDYQLKLKKEQEVADGAEEIHDTDTHTDA